MKSKNIRKFNNWKLADNDLVAVVDVSETDITKKKKNRLRPIC